MLQAARTCCRRCRRSHFVKKYSVQFVNASGKLSAPFYFCDNKPHECSQTWQVVRSEFDQMMLENAREHGVEAHEGVRVLDVLFEGDRAVGVRDPASGRRARREVRAKVVVDASGQSALLQNRFKLRALGSGAEQGRDLDLLEGRLSRHRPRRRRDDGAPDRQPEGLVLVHPAARRHRQRRRRGAVRLPVQGPRHGHEQTYNEEVERCPAVKERIAGADARRPATSRRKDYSYRSTQVAGDGWVLVGDAFGFLDPLYSSGVLLALQVGRDGRRRDRRGAGDGRHVGRAARASGAPGFNEGVDRMRRLVCEYYDGFSFGKFVRQYPELRGTVTDLLIGDLFTDRVDRVWPAMESLRDGSRPPIPPGSAGRRPRSTSRARRSLTLPDGHRP